MTTLIDRNGIASRYGLSYRHVRDSVTKRPDFPAPALRLSQRVVRWKLVEVDKYLLNTGSHKRAAISRADSR